MENVIDRSSPPRGLHIGLWVTQGLVAVAFTGSGLLKAFTPVATLAEQMAWVKAVPASLVPVIGVLEFAGALGLILPSALRIMPKLTVAAAGGLVLTMACAAALHLSLGEPQMIVPNLVLGGLSAFIAWGRAGKAPIAPKR